MDGLVIDAFEFCRLAEHREGEVAVADMPRLAQESVDKWGALQWSLQGGRDQNGYPRLTLEVGGAVRLVCQRCLQPFEFEIDSRSVLVLAQDEASADEIEERLDDESIEVIVGSRSFGILDLIEDEALLMIPQSPKHEVCPNPLPQPATSGAEKDSPFAVLKGLKQPPKQ